MGNSTVGIFNSITGSTQNTRKLQNKTQTNNTHNNAMPLKFLHFQSGPSAQVVEKAVDLRNKNGAPIVSLTKIYSVILRKEIQKALVHWRNYEVSLKVDLQQLDNFPYLVLYLNDHQAPGRNSYPINTLFKQFAESFGGGAPSKTVYRGEVALFKVVFAESDICFDLCNCTMDADFSYLEDLLPNSPSNLTSADAVSTSPDKKRKKRKRRHSNETLYRDDSALQVGTSSVLDQQWTQSEQIPQDPAEKSSECDSEDEQYLNESNSIHVDNWKLKISELSQLDEDEKWTLVNSGSSFDKVILFHYIHNLFMYITKSIELNQAPSCYAVYKSSDRIKLAVNTGLQERGAISSTGEYLYAIFERIDNETQWKIVDFSPWFQCVVNHKFGSKRPEIVKLFSDKDLYFDVDREIEINWQHIFEHKERLPQHLQNEWIFKMFLNGYLRSHLYPSMTRSSQIAVPAVYKKKDGSLSLQFLLPLSFSNPKRTDLVLTVRPVGECYLGHTVLYTDWAYSLARSIQPPNAMQPWLRDSLEG